MAAIGTFTAQGEAFTGSIETLTLNVFAGIVIERVKLLAQCPLMGRLTRSASAALKPLLLK